MSAIVLATDKSVAKAVGAVAGGRATPEAQATFATGKTLRMASFGASIMYNGHYPNNITGDISNETASISAMSIIAHAMGRLGGRYSFAGAFATGGYTTQNVLDIWLNPLLAASPDIALTGDSPINDIQVLGLTAPQIAVVMKKLLDSLIANNITPVVVNSKPVDGWTTAQKSTQRLYNKWLARYCQKNNIIMVDIFSLFADTSNVTNGGPNNIPGICYDVVHPNSFGARLAGQAVADAIDGLPSAWAASSKRLGSEDDPDSMFTATSSMNAIGASLPSATLSIIKNGARLVTITGVYNSQNATSPVASFQPGDVGREIFHAGFPSGTKIQSVTSPTAAVMDRVCKVAGAAAATIMPPPGPMRGQEIVLTTTGAGSNILFYICSGPNSSFIPGHRIQFSVYIDVPFVNPGETWAIYLYDGTNSNFVVGTSNWDQPYVGWFRCEFTVPPTGMSPVAASPQVYVQMLTTNGATAGTILGISEMTIEDLTALGLAA